MRAFWTLLWQELVSSKMILLTAFVASWLPVLAPLLPGNERFSPSELQTAVLAVVAPGLGGLILLGIGSSFLGRDLSEQRLGFYFTRPIPGWTLWLAKLLGSYLVVLTSFCLIVLPALLLSPEVRPMPRSFGKSSFFWLDALLVPLVLLALIHAISVILRARTAWLVFDLLAIAGCVFLGWRIYDVLRSNDVHFSVSRSAETLLLLGLLTSLLVAGGLQTAIGRTDLARSHRVLSLALWIPVLLLGTLLAGGVVWLTSPQEAEIEALQFAEVSPGGEWVLIGGSLQGRPGYHGMFLLHAESGQSVHVGSLASAQMSRFSDDGSTMVTPRCRRQWYEPCDLYRFDLTLEQPRAVPLDLDIASLFTALSLSRNGQRLAIYQSGQLTVHDLNENRLLDARRLDSAFRLHFENADRLRFYQQPEGWRILQMELDLSDGSLKSLGEIPEDRITYFLKTPPGIAPEFLPSAPIADHVRTFKPELRFLDAYSSIQLPMDLPRTYRTLRLADGRLAIGALDRSKSLKIFSADGTEERRISLPPTAGKTTEIILASEIRPGQLVAGLHQNENEIQPKMIIKIFWETYLLDVDTGEWTLLEKDRMPLAYEAAGSERLFFVDNSKLVVQEPNAEPRTILEFAARWI